MIIEFAYDINKDVENFIKTLNSINNKEYTMFQKAYLNKHGENFEPEQIKRFIGEYVAGIDMVNKVSEIKNTWLPIQDRFFQRAEKLFGIAYPIKTIQAYLTTNQRCGYNIEENYFFLYFESKNTNLIIMHELFHFYTWHVFYRKLSEQGISKERYNDIKESLTVLLNIEFADLLDGAEDKGYPQHANLRNQIIDLRKPGKTLHEIVAILTV